jgi:hypothetical protein
MMIKSIIVVAFPLPDISHHCMIKGRHVFIIAPNTSSNGTVANVLA